MRLRSGTGYQAFDKRHEALMQEVERSEKRIQSLTILLNDQREHNQDLQDSLDWKTEVIRSQEEVILSQRTKIRSLGIKSRRAIAKIRKLKQDVEELAEAINVEDRKNLRLERKNDKLQHRLDSRRRR
jgi:hypothetical protein